MAATAFVRRLVTGANKGIGFEIARSLGALGIFSLMGCRDEERSREAEKALHADGLNVRAIPSTSRAPAACVPRRISSIKKSAGSTFS